MSNPEVMWSKAFAWNATNKNTIQDERQSGQAEQDANLKDGFPLITMTPQDAGGIAPNGQDMNGALYAISLDMVHRQKGLRIQFDPAYAAKIGGYDQGCILASNDYTRDYISLIPNNLIDPNGSGTAGKWAIYAGAGSIASATASIAGIVKIVDNLSSNATDAALTANQGRVLSDRTQPATTTNVGITRFATATEVANKQNVSAAVTPANVKSMFTGTRSTNGYEILPSGLILQWGTTGAVSYDTSINIDFPLAFPNSCLNITASPRAINQQSFNGATSAYTSNVTRTGATLTNDSSTSREAFAITWFAIGY